MPHPKRYLITAALPYANGPLHIGHLAGAYLPADIYARYLRLKDKEVAFICGSDEHGVPITIRAKEEGVSPQEVVDRYHSINKEAFEQFGISFDIYHRTSDPLHHQTASAFFSTLHDKGVFIKQEAEQYYDEEAKQFLADRYIKGTCPKCSYDNAYGDQCEKCGSSLSPQDLIQPKSMLSGNVPVLKKTEHWYLPLDKMQEEWLEEWIDSHKKDWKTNVYGQCKSWLDQGLQVRAVTRDLDWGVPVPLPEGKGKVLYVWFDAPIGYISATKALFKDTPTDWQTYWKDKNTKLVHFIGKDNIVFHCIIFPAMLKAHGEYILPEAIPANEFLNLEGNKLSTSRNWAVWVHEYLNDFPDKQDVLRYVLCSIAPESKDSEFTWKDFQARNNNELVAIFGNFINRAVVLTHKFFDGVIPEGDTEEASTSLTTIHEAYQKIGQHIEKYEFRAALGEAMNIARMGNKYLADKEPWQLIKTDKHQTGVILNHSLQIAAHLTILFKPFLPSSCNKIAHILNLSENLKWDTKEVLLREGHTINPAELLFQKLEDDIINTQIQKLESSKSVERETSTIKPMKPEITFEDFSSMDIRIGTILEAVKVPKTDKLLQLKVDTGTDIRTVVSGIAQYYQPEDIIGQKVSILLNLAPRKLRGIESQGMILMAENEKGDLAFVAPTKDCNNGGEVK